MVKVTVQIRTYTWFKRSPFRGVLSVCCLCPICTTKLCLWASWGCLEYLASKSKFYLEHFVVGFLVNPLRLHLGWLENPLGRLGSTMKPFIIGYHMVADSQKVCNVIAVLCSTFLVYSERNVWGFLKGVPLPRMKSLWHTRTWGSSSVFEESFWLIIGLCKHTPQHSTQCTTTKHDLHI